MSPALHRDGQDWLLRVRVQPRASRTGFDGVMGDRLRVRLNAPPVDGRDKCLRLHGLDAIPAALQSALDGQM